MIRDNPQLDETMRLIIERHPQVRRPLRTFAPIILELADEDEGEPEPKKRRADA